MKELYEKTIKTKSNYFSFTDKEKQTKYRKNKSNKALGNVIFIASYHIHLSADIKMKKYNIYWNFVGFYTLVEELSVWVRTGSN